MLHNGLSWLLNSLLVTKGYTVVNECSYWLPRITLNLPHGTEVILKSMKIFRAGGSGRAGGAMALQLFRPMMIDSLDTLTNYSTRPCVLDSTRVKTLASAAQLQAGTAQLQAGVAQLHSIARHNYELYV